MTKLKHHRITALAAAVLALGANIGRANDALTGMERPRANQGLIPQPPAKRSEGTAPEAQQLAGGRSDSTPHVDENRWYGHDRPEDPRYALLSPFLHGRFEHLGAGYRYGVVKVDVDRHLIWLPGAAQFRVADWDWPIWREWCSDCGNDFVIFADPDHNGWYLLYDVHVGGFVHVEYLGEAT